MSDSLAASGKVFVEQTQSYVSALSEHYQAIAPKPADGGQSLDGANLEYILRGSAAHLQAIKSLLRQHDEKNLLNHFDALRDALSLLPRNPYSFRFLAELLITVYPEDCAALRDLCKDQVVILHISCRSRMSKARASKASFKQKTSKCVHVVVVGLPGRVKPPKRLGFRFRKGVLRLPVPDTYEFLADKVFFAYLILTLVGESRLTVKIDDDHRLSDPELFFSYLQSLDDSNVAYAGRFLKGGYYRREHGWHIDKCSNVSLHQIGYQCPFPSRYADGGFGYVLNADALKACAAMYLGMRNFFAMHAVQLEDVYTGLATEAWGLELQDCHEVSPRLHENFYLVEEAALPGLRREM